MKTWKLWVGGIAFIAFLASTPFISLAYKTYFAPKLVELQRTVDVQSRMATEANIRDLRSFKLQYIKEDNPAAKDAILASVRHLSSSFPRENLPNDLHAWLLEIEQ